jgi:glycosyltransferase involved in cell wall biosynthesis
MPTFGYWATRLVREHDVLSLHLPQIDAAGLALRGRAFGKPVILTYHCDLLLPPGRFNHIVNQSVFAANYLAGRLANWVVAYTQDYAAHSRYLRHFSRKLAVIPPPVVMPAPSEAALEAFRQSIGNGTGPTIGFAARFAAEKGIEYLVDAMPTLLERFPTLRVLFAGPYRDVIGEEQYQARIRPRIDDLGDHWRFLGTLDQPALAAFYTTLDCLLVTSVNSTESFGLVQVEAMLNGTPVVASDLPGVRQPVLTTGMGVVVPVADSDGLAAGITTVLEERERFLRPREEIERLYDVKATVDAYEQLFERERRARKEER